MKVVDLQQYRLLKQQRALEQKISDLSLSNNPSNSFKIKTAFKEWYQMKLKQK